ncbi:hypothetical protein T492DRAFT_210728 [Pavlovales sp. CCMP2436]|nr:hypothetical protein T492DRAFT_210728 [Pavlovales sp. CCMP2436]
MMESVLESVEEPSPSQSSVEDPSAGQTAGGATVAAAATPPAAPQTLEQAFGVDGERTLGSFSCELETEATVYPGRLFVFESAAGFYANAFGEEIVEVIPFSRVEDLSKRNIALFIPHALDISLSGRTLTLCSFTHREEVFSLLKQQWTAAFRKALTTVSPVSVYKAVLGETVQGPTARISAPVGIGRAETPSVESLVQLASSPPNSGTALTQRLRVATNACLAGAIGKGKPLTTVEDAEVCLRLLVAMEAVRLACLCVACVCFCVCACVLLCACACVCFCVCACMAMEAVRLACPNPNPSPSPCPNPNPNSSPCPNRVLAPVVHQPRVRLA